MQAISQVVAVLAYRGRFISPSSHLELEADRHVDLGKHEPLWPDHGF